MYLWLSYCKTIFYLLFYINVKCKTTAQMCVCDCAAREAAQQAQNTNPNIKTRLNKVENAKVWHHCIGIQFLNPQINPNQITASQSSLSSVLLPFPRFRWRFFPNLMTTSSAACQLLLSSLIVSVSLLKSVVYRRMYEYNRNYVGTFNYLSCP